MPLLAHFGMGFAGKRLAPQIPLWALLVSALGPDVIALFLFVSCSNHLNDFELITDSLGFSVNKKGEISYKLIDAEKRSIASESLKFKVSKDDEITLQFKTSIPKVKTKLSFNEKREYEALEKEIEELEKEKEEVENVLNSGIDDYEKLNKLSARIGELIEMIDAKTMRWMELDEFA